MTERRDLHPELAVDLEPVLRDLAVLPFQPRIEPGDWSSDPEQFVAESWWPDATSTGIAIQATQSPAERIASLADQIQEAAVEALPGVGHPAVWPACPDHPNGHPMRAISVDGTALWTCPRTGRRIAEIGSLAPIGRARRRRRD